LIDLPPGIPPAALFDFEEVIGHEHLHKPDFTRNDVSGPEHIHAEEKSLALRARLYLLAPQRGARAQAQVTPGRRTFQVLAALP
jgi:hypothetical protein